MKPILEVEHITKEFLIGGEQERYLALRDVLSNPFKKLRQPPKQQFKALDDVSFTVMPGDSVGIIGRNGAGKSTLLKILSHITPPSSGRIICRGRTASLLEVGTGFHQELTGRENIYMNGSILGMRRAEINKHFNAIVEFSGVEKFLDTPLKRYSSGMQLRLAFAVAAHLEPEILIVDEVLAVGDSEFQKKCLGKMNEVSKSGRTVLFVSHHMGTIAQLCRKVLVLNKGRVLNYANDAMAGIEQYLKLNKSIASFENERTGKNMVSPQKITLSNAGGEQVDEFTNKDEIVIDFDLEFTELPANTSLFVSVLNQYKMPVFSEEKGITGSRMRLRIMPEFLVQGSYSLVVIIHQVPNEQYFKVEDVCQFNIIDTDSKMIIYNNYNYNYGNVFGKSSWE